MNLVSDLDRPAYGHTAPDFSACIVLDHDSGEFFLRSRASPQLDGVEGLNKLPIIWSGSSKVNPNRGPVPYVS